ncbi:MAG: hypothetical protein JXM70_22580 [Pirellulales bacterium]|nr:hypothetical protein [Pirellulales bacterium]
MEDWPAGSFAGYCGLLFSLKTCLPFYPLLLYSIVCMVCMIVRPQRYSRLFVVRLGIFTGVPLALQYFVLLAIASREVDFISTPLLAMFLWGCAWLFAWPYSCRKSDKPSVGLKVLGVIAGLALIYTLIPPNCFVVPLACSTPWAIIAYAMMSWQIFRHRTRGPWQFSLAQLFIFIFWLAAYCSAWRISAMAMLAE